MTVIAVAGGTGPGLGRNIVIGSAQNPKHKVIVLSRESSKIPEWLANLQEVEVRKVDYTSVENLKKALQGVETVISTLLSHDGTWAAAQIILVEAAVAVGAKRFIPSEWGFGHLSAERTPMFAPMLEVREACRKAVRENPGNFEWTAISNGAFMNYLGQGAANPDAKNGLQEDHTLCFDIENNKALVPLTRDGKVPKLIFTELGDIGRAVSAAVELPFGQWNEFSGFVGDAKGMDEIVAIIEKVRGKKVAVDYLPYDVVLEQRKSAEDPLTQMWFDLIAAIAREDENESIFEGGLNKALGDKVKPISVEGYVTKFWS